MKSSIKNVNIVIVAAIVSLAALLVVGVNAQTPGGSGLRVSPTRSELVLVPGDSTEITHRVKNVTQGPITVQPQLNDFESDGVTGEPRLLGVDGDISAYSLREFITLPAEFDLAPDEEREVVIATVVPDNASPGAYFGSVLYRAVPFGASDDGQVSLVASVGSLVLLEVPGDITEKIQINDISGYLGDNSGSIFTKKPDGVGVLIENLGNGFSQPFGKVNVADWRGNVVFEYELNDVQPRGNILPESERLFLNELYNIEQKSVNGEEVIEKNSPLKWPGRYTITGNISHGSSGEIFTVKSTFWYLPLWAVVIVVSAVVLLVLLAVYLYRKFVTKSTKRKR